MPSESSSSPYISKKDRDNMPGQSQSIKSAFCLNVAHNLTQIMLGGVVISAYCILMTQATLAFSPFGWANNMKYEQKILIHFTLQMFGCICVITGSAIMMAHVSYNFSACHGTCDIVVMLLTILTLLEGLLSVICPKQMRNEFKKIVHAYVGAATLCLVFIAQIFAFHYYYRIALGGHNANTAIVRTVLSLIGTLLMASIRKFKRILRLRRA